VVTGRTEYYTMDIAHQQDVVDMLGTPRTFQADAEYIREYEAITNPQVRSKQGGPLKDEDMTALR